MKIQIRLNSETQIRTLDLEDSGQVVNILAGKPNQIYIPALSSAGFKKVRKTLGSVYLRIANNLAVISTGGGGTTTTKIQKRLDCQGQDYASFIKAHARIAGRPEIISAFNDLDAAVQVINAFAKDLYLEQKSYILDTSAGAAFFPLVAPKEVPAAAPEVIPEATTPEPEVTPEEVPVEVTEKAPEEAQEPTETDDEILARMIAEEENKNN